MKHYKLLAIAGIILSSLALSCTKTPTTDTDKSGAASSEEQDFFYTCPMHPEVHQDHPGKCPICHMMLVKKSKTAEVEDKESLSVSSSQLDLIGVKKYVVKKMDLVYAIPISGRFSNSNQLAFQVYEEDLAKIKIGDIVVGSADRQADLRLRASIQQIDNYVDPSSRTLRVTARISTNASHIPIESGFRGQIKIEKKNVLAIPETAVLHAGSKNIVFIFDKEQKSLKQKILILGTKFGEYYEVLNGLKEGDSISNGANFLLDSESKIRGIGK